MMEKILVTGGIAAGKSAVCRYLASKGYPVYDSDSRTKSLYETVPALKGRIEASLGIPFSELSVIFKDKEKRGTLESIVHPLVLEDFEKWCAQQTSEKVFFESAIALQSPVFKGVFDKVVLVKAPLEQRLERNAKTSERASLQAIDESLSDIIIVNDSDFNSLYEKIDNTIL